MDKNHDEKEEGLPQTQTKVWNLIFSCINSFSLKCAVELGIPDAIHNHGKAMTINELVPVLSINKAKASCLSRLMRVLVHSGFFGQQKADKEESKEEEVAYSLTPASRLFLTEEPLNLCGYLGISLHPLALDTWQSFGAWFRNNDRDAFSTVHGVSMWEIGAGDPDLAEVFNQGMGVDSQIIVNMLTDTGCWGVFDGLDSVLDIGGGTGTMAKAITKRFPNMKCSVFERPEVVCNLVGTENVEFVGGDMFVKIPPANAILLKWILHDWEDEQCLKILKNCKEAIIQCEQKNRKLIIIEMVVEKKKGNEHVYQAQLYFDMLMMANLRGKERDEREWAKLFSDAGFSHYKITPTLGARSIIEVYP